MSPLLVGIRDVYKDLRYHYEVTQLRNEPQVENMILVTGADSTHYYTLRQFLRTARRHEQSRLVVYDLGLTNEELAELKSEFRDVEFRRFEYERYPDYFNIKKDAGVYAWKPVIVASMLEATRTCVCWMDAGNLIKEPLNLIRKVLHRNGFYSPRSHGTIKRWTHPTALKVMNVEDNLLNKHNLNGACVAVNYAFPRSVALVKKWKEFALNKQAIAPPGWTRENHRWDQTILSVLAHQMGLAKDSPWSFLGFVTHQDID